MKIDQKELGDMVMVMVLAAIQADGKDLSDVSDTERQSYIDLAVADIGFALSVRDLEFKK